jgi:hypothetical protein
MRVGRTGRATLAAVACAVALLALTACGTQRAGAAAVAGDERLTEREVADQLDELSELYDQNPDAERLSDTQLTQASISWWLNAEVMSAFAADNDIDVTATQVDQVLGPDYQREQISLGAGIAPSQLESAAEALVAYQIAAENLAGADGSPQEAAAELAVMLEQTARDIDVRVNPRFGSGWVPGLEQQLAPRNPERLSSPAQGTETVPEFALP